MPGPAESFRAFCTSHPLACARRARLGRVAAPCRTGHTWLVCTFPPPLWPQIFAASNRNKKNVHGPSGSALRMLKWLKANNDKALVVVVVSGHARHVVLITCNATLMA